MDVSVTKSDSRLVQVNLRVADFMADPLGRYVDDTKKINICPFSGKEVGFFEGPEKLLEVWFELTSRGPDEVTTTYHDEKVYGLMDIGEGLRIIPRYVPD